MSNAAVSIQIMSRLLANIEDERELAITFQERLALVNETLTRVETSWNAQNETVAQ